MSIGDRIRRLCHRRRRNCIDERRSISLHDAKRDPKARAEYCDNTVTSAKYNVITFLPLNLFDQLQRPINVYFVLLSALQFIPSVAPVNPYTTLFPLAIALLANTVKEGFDDLRRHRQDRENNSRVHRIVDPHTRRIKEVASKSIQVGDVVVLGPSETVPCDVVVLFTSGAYGEALVSTASIDGETGTKEKHALLNNCLTRSPSDGEALRATTQAYAHVHGPALTEIHSPSVSSAADVEAAMCFLEQSQLVLDSEGPNPFLHAFTGAIHYTAPLSCSAGAHEPSSDPRRCLAALAPTPPAMVRSGPSVRLRMQSGSSSNSALGETDETSRLLDADGSVVNRGGYVRAATDERTSTAPPFAGSGHPPPFTGTSKTQAVTPDNLILASSRVENTRMVLGLAVFTGMESKLNMTRSKPVTKVASIDRSLNLLAIPIFAFEFTLVVIYSLLACVHLGNAPKRAWYLGLTDAHAVPSNEYFPILPLRFFTMLTPMVPMSFKTMIEISKGYVSAVIRWDDALKHDGKPVMVNNSALAEELGKVEYVLSDKTGTFTQNQMRFRCLVTADEPPLLYEHLGALSDTGYTTRLDADGDEDPRARSTPSRPPPPPSFARAPTARPVSDEPGTTTHYLVLGMAFCNTIEAAMTTAPPLEASLSDLPAAGATFDWSGDAATGRGKHHRRVASGPSAPNPKWLSVSPDEMALVDGAETLGGLRLLHRTRHTVKAEYVPHGATPHLTPPLTVRATVCKTLEFTSERGRMSVLLRLNRNPELPPASPSSGPGPSSAQPALSHRGDVGKGEYILLMKGSDESVLPLCDDRLRSGQRAQILRTLERLASCGLRTLVYGYRCISSAEAKRWLESYETSTARCLTAEDRQTRIKSLYAELERDVTYCGCTAVEDLLQEALPETITQLRNAGIRTWVLTGDRTETARQTAVASGLLRPRDTLVSLLAENTAGRRQTAADHFAHVKTQVDRAWIDLARLGIVGESERTSTCEWGQRWRRWYAESGLRDVVQEFTQRRAVDGDGVSLKPLSSQLRHAAPYASFPLVHRLTTGSPSPTPTSAGLDYCVLLSGGVTKMILTSSDADLRRRFRLVLLHARTVICSRTAPDQKALFVDMVRASGKVTLAIGDGGNDVAMIQSAHVGVGIRGREGNQAALAADFAIGEFRLLARLLLVHGHMAYERSAMIIQQSFWKTVLIAWVQMLFNHWTDFSGISYWDSYSLMLYNAIPTVPVTFLCVMDVPLSPVLLLQNPQLYTMSQRGRYLSVTTFYGYVSRALLHGSAVFLLSVGLQCSGVGGILRNGWELDRQGDFYAAYFAVVTIHTFTVCIESHSITFAHWQCFFFSVWSCFLCFGLAAATPGTNQTFSVLLRNPSFYLQYVALTTTVCLSLSLYATVKVLWFPDLLQLQRGAIRAVEGHSFRRRWGAQYQRLMRLLWRDDNPSTLLWSLIPFGRGRSLEHVLLREDEEVATRSDADVGPTGRQGDTPV